MPYYQFLIYTSLVVFAGGSILKILKYVRMPAHLRWELYPIPGNNKYNKPSSEEYGDTKKKSFLRYAFLERMKYIAREILLFEKCYRNNRGLWILTYPFHIGLFLLLFWLILLFTVELATLIGMSPHTQTTFEVATTQFLIIIGTTGFILSSLGSIGLIIKRIIDPNLKQYTSSLHFCNLVLLSSITLSCISSWALFDRSFISARQTVSNLVTFSPMNDTNPLMILGLILFSIFLMYMPFSSMMHGIAKYFTYHGVLWDCAPISQNTILVNQVTGQKNYPLGWRARHIEVGKSWEINMRRGNKGNETKNQN